MTNFDNMEQNFAALTEEELTDVNGGIAPIVIGGVVVSWKLIGAGAGVAAGYYANRP